MVLQLWKELCNARNTDDLKAIACDIVDKVCTLDFHILDGRGKGCAEQHACTYGIERLSEFSDVERMLCGAAEVSLEAFCWYEREMLWLSGGED